MCYPNSKVRASNGQTVVRMESTDTNLASSNNKTPDQGILSQSSSFPETGGIGLPLADCEKPAPWSTPPQKTYKQVIIEEDSVPWAPLDTPL